MKKSIVLFVILAILVTPVFAMGAKEAVALPATSKNSVAAPATLEEKVSYSFGYLVYSNIKAEGIDINADLFAAGAQAANSGEPIMTQEEMQAAITEYQTIMQEKQAAEQEVVANANLKRAQEFLAANATKEGVMVTPEGVQYKFETKGEGALPVATDTVIVDYELKDLDGNVIDSSYERGEKATFPLSNLIKGFQYGMAVTPVGSKVTLWISPDLGYGAQGNPNIPANSLLEFVVELHEIVVPEETTN